MPPRRRRGGPRAAPSLAIVEPEEADRARACMRAENGAERRGHFDLRLRPQVGYERAQRLRPLRRVCMRDPDAETRRVLRALGQRVRELLNRLLVPADALQRQHLAVRDREDGLDVEQAPGERRRLADAAALLQELERVDGEDDPRVALEPLDELGD